MSVDRETVGDGSQAIIATFLQDLNVSKGVFCLIKLAYFQRCSVLCGGSVLSSLFLVVGSHTDGFVCLVVSSKWILFCVCTEFETLKKQTDFPSTLFALS